MSTPLTRDSAGDLELSFRGRAVVRPLYLAREEARLFRRWLEILRRPRRALRRRRRLRALRVHRRVARQQGPRRVRPPRGRAAGPGRVRRGRLRDRAARPALARQGAQPAAPARHPLRGAAHDAAADHRRLAAHVARGEVPRRAHAGPGPEETIATKAYIANRDRFDGADILHIIRALQGEVDWQRLVDLLEGDEEIVLWHLVLFAFTYPMHREWLPRELMQRAFERLQTHARRVDARAFRGMVLDPVSFRVDVAEWGYRDAGATAPDPGPRREGRCEGGGARRPALRRRTGAPR